MNALHSPQHEAFERPDNTTPHHCLVEQTMRAGSPAAPGVVKKVEGGFDKPHAEQELPLDINYQKLVEWLVSWCCRQRQQQGRYVSCTHRTRWRAVSCGS